MSCDFRLTNRHKAQFPCQRPQGHRGAHSLSRHKGDDAPEPLQEYYQARHDDAVKNTEEARRRYQETYYPSEK